MKQPIVDKSLFHAFHRQRATRIALSRYSSKDERVFIASPVIKTAPVIVASLMSALACPAMAGSLQLLPLEIAPSGVSGDGTIVVGWTQTQGYRWTAATGPEAIAISPNGISGDGLTVVGKQSNDTMGYWRASSGVVAGPLAGSSSASSITFDGNKIIVNDIGGAYLWTVDANQLEATPALTISADGNTLGGVAFVEGRYRGFVQDLPSGITTILPERPECIDCGGGVSNVGYLSTNGVVASGTYCSGSMIGVGACPSWSAFRWTAQEGMTPVGNDLPGIDLRGTHAYGMSAYGEVIVGRLATPPVPGSGAAFVWTPTGGAHYLSDVLASQGITADPELFDYVTGISSDGRTLVGYGRGAPVGSAGRRMTQGWIATIDPSAIVPLPSAAWLFSAALGVMGWMRRQIAE